VQGRIADAFLSRDGWLDALLAAIDQGAVSIKQLDARRRQRLLNHERADVRARAEAMLAGLVNPDRQAVIEHYKEVTTLPGQFLRGRGIFRERCASCHKLGEIGHAVGPDLAALTDRSRESLLVAVLDPNRSVETRYGEYRVETKDFASYSGVLASENANSVTIVAPNGIENTVLRRDIESMQASVLSPMPEGLEDGLSVEDMANLLAFVQDFRSAPKHFEGNTPRAVQPDSRSGEIVLMAETAEIYGDTLQYERHHQNLGFWGSANDLAVWRVRIEQGGVFDAALTYACAPSTPGNTFIIRASESVLGGVVNGTGSWDDYREARVGRIEIPAGTDRISIQAAGPLNGYLFDLRRVVLRPARK
jgi:putative heme-binding domain-containing protein